MIKTSLRRLVYGKPSPEAQLIARANGFPRYTPTTIQYAGFTIKVTDMLSVAWQIQEFFGEERMKFSADGPSPVIVDCGANVGVSILYYKSRFPASKVICFEPDAAVRACLETNMEANGITDVNCRPEVVWVDDRGVLFGSEGADGGSVLRTAGAAVLPSVRLKDVLREVGSIDLLKVDIEGAESEVLLDCGDELKRVKYLYVEYHSFPDRPQTLGALLELLTTNGFRYYIHRIGVHHKHPFAGLEAADMDLQLDIHAIRG
ncbi:MAG: FkbM family methyltransferase [Flavobacteriales bacterium]|nr:FkbM family methyltransferase [Flavobacteriales bacterium]MBP7154696.1 FkbM family methyltransferase [Flavobacteriales bacterium]HQW41754.1 FkbM family methyltransferase [Flavobacteriales bacterium]